MKRDELIVIDFEKYLKICYKDIKPFLIDSLNVLRNQLIALPEHSKQERILSLFEETVKKLNEIDQNKAIVSRIDTEEREGLCNVLYQLGDIVGLDSRTEYIDNWRAW